MKRALTTALLVVTGLLSACGAPQAPAGKAKFAIVGKNAGNPYGDKEMEGFRQAIEEQGGIAILKAPGEPTARAQIEIIEALIKDKVAAIAVAADDRDALEPVLKKAMAGGIKVLSLDSAVNFASRMVHINQADPERIGRVQIQAIAEMVGNAGDIAVLSATAQATNQNLWIEWMKRELAANPRYKDINLVKVAYGDDEHERSVARTEDLLAAYPNLKGIVAPTTVGIAAAGQVLAAHGLKDKVHLTGLGLPSEMAPYIESGVCQWMYLWNPVDVGLLAGYVADALVKGSISGRPGDKLQAGRLGEKQVIADGEGTQVMLGDPYRFDATNIAEWKNIY